MLTIREAAVMYQYCYERMRQVLAGVKPDDMVGQNKLYRPETVEAALSRVRRSVPIRFRDRVSS